MTELTMSFTGDSLLTRPLSTLNDPGLDRLRALVGQTDVAYTNLEFTCAEPPLVPSPRLHGLHVYSPPSVLDELRDFGFNLFSLAHNHTMDYLAGGLLQTLEAVRARGMACAGAGPTLTEARRPRYLDVDGRRVAIVAACSTDAAHTLAADPDGVTEGRPGISPLRFSVDYELADDHFAALGQIDEALGTSAGTRSAEALGIVVPEAGHGQQLRFLGSRFVAGDTTRVRSRPNQLDVDDIVRWIHDARGQADVVVMTLHCHEGASGQYNSDTIADFAREAAHRFLDAGADIFVGHGPHQLAAVEVYDGKPVFHSLGNFAFMPETVATLPHEFLVGTGLPYRSTAVDFYNRREGGEGTGKGFTGFTAYWESIVPVCRFDGGRVTGLDLWPILLDSSKQPSRRGFPRLADGEDGEAVLHRLAGLSVPFDTTIDIEIDGGQPVGRVRLPSSPTS